MSRLFADPDWDGPIEMNEDFDSEKENDKPVPKKGSGTSDPPTPPDPKKPKPIVDKDGCRVEIIYKTASIMMQAGNCSGRKALLTTRKKISVARTLHWTILSVNGLLKKRKKKSGSFFWSMVLTLKH